MSETEHQYMEMSENGHEGEEDLNGAEQYEGDNGDAQAGAEGDDGADETGIDEDPQNGATDGGQIDASKGEEDAGYVLKNTVLNAGM